MPSTAYRSSSLAATSATRRRPRAIDRARAGLVALVLLCGASASAAALLPELGERRVVPGTELSVPIAAGEPGASLYIERAPLGAELLPAGPDRWSLVWDVPSRISERTVVRLGAVDPKDRTRRESRELVLVRGIAASTSVDPPSPSASSLPEEPVAGEAEGAGPEPLEIPMIEPGTLVAGRDWRLSLPVRGGADGAPVPARLELRGAPAGMTARANGDGWHTLRWRPAPTVTGTWTVELVATDARDPTRRVRRRMTLEVRPAVVEVPAATRRPAPERAPGPTPAPLAPAASGTALGAPTLDALTNHVVNPGQDVSFRVETLDGRAAKVEIDRLPRAARFDANEDGSRTFYWPTSDRDQGEHRFRFTAADPTDPSRRDSADVLIVVGDPSRGRTVPAGDPLPGVPGAPAPVAPTR